MKTSALLARIARSCVFTLLLFCAFSSRSQHIIRFTDGTEQKVLIVYLSSDTLKYYNIGNPDLVFTQTMDHVSGITPYDPVKYKSDSISAWIKEHPDLWRYQRKVSKGAVLTGLGTLFTGLAISAIVAQDNITEMAIAAIFTAPLSIGGIALLIPGIISLSVGISGVSRYKKEHPGLSVDLKCSPKMTGVSLVYRF